MSGARRASIDFNSCGSSRSRVVFFGVGKAGTFPESFSLESLSLESLSLESLALESLSLEPLFFARTLGCEFLAAASASSGATICWNHCVSDNDYDVGWCHCFFGLSATSFGGNVAVDKVVQGGNVSPGAKFSP